MSAFTSQSTTRPWRVRIELTFQVAMRMGQAYSAALARRGGCSAPVDRKRSVGWPA